MGLFLAYNCSDTKLLTLRLQDFPRGLGKGSDAAVVGSWLEIILARLTEADVPVS